MRKVPVLMFLAAVSACAPKLIPVPVVTTPRFPEFVQPAVPASFADSAAAAGEDRGWRFLQAGDLKNAEREFSTALQLAAAFYPAETSLGYVEMARKDAASALPHFDRALARQQDDVSALLGRGQALVALSREAEALTTFEAVLAVDPSLGDVRRRVEVLKFRGLEQDLARAREAARAGQLDAAATAYANAIASSPDSAFLYRELAAVERQKGDDDRALEHFRKAVALDGSDAKSLVQVGEILETRGDFGGAEQEYLQASTIEPSDALNSKIEAVRARAELARLPEEYRAIDQSPEITRADLAALIGVRLAPLLQGTPRGEVVLITDVRASWASTWIMAVARAGVMEPLANHAFQPRTLVRRVDLAQAVSRLLARIAAGNPSVGKSWEGGRVRFADLSPGHLAYPAASAAVTARVMTMGPDNSFQPSKPVSGHDAVAAINQIEALAGTLVKPRAKSGR
jgi:tetratricopeptide (TPR) repeat protein